MLPVQTYKLKCEQCGRKILVSVVLIGVSHNHRVVASCAECLKKAGLNADWKADHPQEAKDIESWVAAP